MHWTLKHQWLAFRRSPAFEKDLGIKIFLAIIGIFFLFNLVFISLNLGEILNEFRGDTSKVGFLNQL